MYGVTTWNSISKAYITELFSIPSPLYLTSHPQTRLLYQFRGGYYFTILDVRCIIRALGEP